MSAAALRLITWNVNSVRRRAADVEHVLEHYRPDVLLLQETKVRDEEFPVGLFELAGYSVHFHGQKAYNGVAIASREPLCDIAAGLPGMAAYEGAAPHARLLAATVREVRVVSVYVPNGHPPGSPKYAHKLEFFKRLRAYLAELSAHGAPVVAGGDYNVAPTDDDVYDIDDWGRETIACSPPERAAYAGVLKAGYADAHRALDGAPGSFTWWDYRAGSYQHNRGLRIDHFLTAHVRCASVQVLRELRETPEPSDHAPLQLQLAA